MPAMTRLTRARSSGLDAIANAQPDPEYDAFLTEGNDVGAAVLERDHRALFIVAPILQGESLEGC